MARRGSRKKRVFFLLFGLSSILPPLSLSVRPTLSLYTLFPGQKALTLITVVPVSNYRALELAISIYDGQKTPPPQLTIYTLSLSLCVVAAGVRKALAKGRVNRSQSSRLIYIFRRCVCVCA